MSANVARALAFAVIAFALTMSEFTVQALTTANDGRCANVSANDIRARASASKDYATTTELMNDRSSARRDANATSSESRSTFTRCFSKYAFAIEGDRTRAEAWVVLSAPIGSALNASSLGDAFASLTWATTSEATLRVDVEGTFAIGVVDRDGCVVSDVAKVDAEWTCEGTTTNAAYGAAFAAFGAACAYWFARTLRSSSEEDERQVYLDIVAAFGMKNRARDRLELKQEYESEMRRAVVDIKSEHLLYVTELDLSLDVKNIALDKAKLRRQMEAQSAGAWTQEEETFQAHLSHKERSDHRFASVGARARIGVLKSVASIRHAWTLNSSVFALWFDHRLGTTFTTTYMCLVLLRVQIWSEFLLLIAFAWRRFGFANEMYRDPLIDTIFTPYLFGPDLTDAQAALMLTLWFVVMLFAVVICPLFGLALGRLSAYFDRKMREYADTVESGGDKGMSEYLDKDDGDEERGGGGGGGGSADGDEKPPGFFAKLFSRKSAHVVFDPVRDLEKQRKKIVSDAAWESASDDAIVRAVRSETSAPINMRLIPRGAVTRMELFTTRALTQRRRSRSASTLKNRVRNMGFLLRVFILRIAFVPMIFASLGFLTVSDSFVQTPWVHVTKKVNVAANGNLFMPLCVGLGAIVVSMKTATETETLSPYLRPLPIFDIISTLLKLVMTVIAAVDEGEFGGQGVPAKVAQSSIQNINLFREFALIPICLALLLIHVRLQSLRGFGDRWNANRAAGYAMAFLFAIVAFAARSFNQPPWISHTAPVPTITENLSRPSVIIAIIVTALANVAGRAMNIKRERICIRDEVRKLRDPKYADKEEEILTPEFIDDQVKSASRRDRMVALIAFYALLNDDQKDKLIAKLVRDTKHPKTTEGMDKAWKPSVEAFEELGVIVHCIMEDPDEVFVKRAGEGFVRDALQAFIDATLEMTLWCHPTSDEVVWAAVKRIVTIITDCLKQGDKKTFHSAIATVTMESVQSPEYCKLISALLFNAHDIDLDKDADGNIKVSMMGLRKFVDDAYDITSQPIADKYVQPVTHVRDANDGEVRRLEKPERVAFAVKSWLRPPLDKPRPKLTRLASKGYYAAVHKSREKADGERTKLAQDFMKTLLNASMSPDQQIAFFSVRLILVIARAGHAAATILAIDGLNDLFTCLDASVGKATTTFISEIMQTVTRDKNSRSELLLSLSKRFILLNPDDERAKLHCIELIHQAFKLEMVAVNRCRQLSNGDEYLKYEAAMSSEAAKCAHDALYGALIDAIPLVREHAISALVDLITLYVWGDRKDHYVFTPPESEAYADQAYRTFVNRRERQLPGGVLIANTIHKRSASKREQTQGNAEKLIAVLLKLCNTDDVALVREHAQRGIVNVSALLSSTAAQRAVTLFDDGGTDERAAAPSSKTLRDVTQMIHASVERQHAKDSTASKLRLNDFWRKMKEKQRPTEHSESTRGGVVEIHRDVQDTSKSSAPPGGRVPLIGETIGFKKSTERTVSIVRTPLPTEELERLRRLRLQRAEKSADKRARRDVTSERWYGAEGFKKKQPSSESALDNDVGNGSPEQVGRVSAKEELNKRPTYTPREWGTTKLPKDIRAPPKRDDFD